MLASLHGWICPEEPMPPGPRSGRQEIFTILGALYGSKLLRYTAMEITPGDLSAAQPSFPRDRRDVRRAIEHWFRNTWAADSIPMLDTFDFSPMRRDWGQRFLICGGDAVEDAVFVTYGLGFARLLGLPQKAVTTNPFLQQIPELYRGMFSEGYNKVIIETGPVHLKGTFTKASTFEFYRAVFLPIMLHPTWSKQLIYGSFNYRATIA